MLQLLCQKQNVFINKSGSQFYANYLINLLAKGAFAQLKRLRFKSKTLHLEKWKNYATQQIEVINQQMFNKVLNEFEINHFFNIYQKVLQILCLARINSKKIILPILWIRGLKFVKLIQKTFAISLKFPVSTLEAHFKLSRKFLKPYNHFICYDNLKTNTYYDIITIKRNLYKKAIRNAQAFI
ncbi:unnamed protein product [Paramecium primaurelia]|uniref:Uncharacterized protein n=1 Tax=Paramecium primaurelia TaxID=5886 RepID=A0A8S1KAI8_PARPR|nr:unnamed protein product [Paramecium primaurelia]